MSSSSTAVLHSAIDGAALRRDGLVTFAVDTAAVDDVVRIYRRLRMQHAGFRRCRPAPAPASRRGARANVVWTEEIPFRTEASGFLVQASGLDGVIDNGGMGAKPELTDDRLAFEVYTTGDTEGLR